MVRNQRKKSRDKRRAATTGASRASAATGKVHRHEPVDVSFLEGLPYAAGNQINVDFASRLVSACRAGCGPCQDTLTRKVVTGHRPTFAALAGAVYGLTLNAGAQHSTVVSAVTRSWSPLALAAAESGDGAAAFAAVEEMGEARAAELLG